MSNMNLGLTGLAAPVLSVAREKIIESRLISELAVLMLRRGTVMDVLRSEFDAQGHDVVLEAAGVIRHVQLKATVEGGKRRDVDINVRLRAKPSGCVVWMNHDPETLAITAYRWFGDEPGEPLPDIGSKVTRHSKGDGLGTKSQRPALRNVPKSSFERLADIGALADRLFGPPRSTATSLVLAQLRQRFGSRWRTMLAAPGPRGFFESIEFAHWVDGYKVLEQLCEIDFAGWLERVSGETRRGRFSPDLGLLWTQLFLEHRRWRQASPAEPGEEDLAWLDELARKVHAGLEQELRLPSI
jgi:hypothetical protein